MSRALLEASVNRSGLVDFTVSIPTVAMWETRLGSIHFFNSLILPNSDAMTILNNCSILKNLIL